ncbi:hypothetical protein A2819_00750 [Candidatus Azambacteria bacterium RIFCSPHIGHO2_01_FULL_40_24]|uniref:Lipocalin-like domain-containing protein n=1 Tax=Candidatus Azambacteria bacterium RIFCSPHIGHO2_01_FULL_40_24 TaxID=1797301 RepID=A0A1F5B2B1_9BACT|nr:MAG: hypothetical protein A2819_00750 [Candidatus Azambacteria bacterium RIFCSPHIGHO2_01_FULL_40_24]
MKRYLPVLLIMALATGCTSVVYKNNMTVIDAKEAERLLIGTWNGYITHSRAHVIPNTTLQIFQVEKTIEGNWSIALSLNGKWINAAELTINESVIRLEFIEHYANLLIFHDLVLYNDRHLIGRIWYGTRSYTPAEVTFEKISR